MAKLPFYNPKARFFDANGDPLPGGLLYTYAANSEDPLDTFTTREGDVPNDNPVELDANGEADIWLTPGVNYKFELHDAADVPQWTVDDVPTPAEEDASTADAGIDPGGRISLTSGLSVTGDVSGATTVYYVPHNSNKVPLWNGTTWAVQSIDSQLSQTNGDNTKSPAAVAVNSAYDVFVWDDAGTLRATRGPAWSSLTVRGTGVGTSELERLDGRWTNKHSISNGPAANYGLYVGSFRSDASAEINDTLVLRHVSNFYNYVDEVGRHMPAFAPEYVSAAGYRNATPQLIPDASSSLVINFNTTDNDTHGAISNPTTNWTFTVPVSGRYFMTATVGITPSNPNIIALGTVAITCNGTRSRQSYYRIFGTNAVHVSLVQTLTAGQTIQVVVDYDGDGDGETDPSIAGCSISIHKLPGA